MAVQQSVEPHTVSVLSLPDDFQILLYQLFEAGDGLSYSIPLPDALRVHQCDIDDHATEFDENLDYWNEDDFRIAAGYARRMNLGQQFPPVVAQCPRGLLVDGYHRIGACRLLGRKMMDVIYLSDYDTEVRYDYTRPGV